MLAGGASPWWGEASPVHRGWVNVLPCRAPEEAAAKPREAALTNNLDQLY